MDVGLHFRKRDAERLRDVEVAQLLEVKQHERHALVIRQVVERLLEPLIRLSSFETRERRDPGFNCDVLDVHISLVGSPPARQVAEQPPPRSISRQMVQTGVSRDGLEPSGRRRTVSDLIETLKRFQKHDLRDILGLGPAAEQPDRRREDQVLVLQDERLEPVG